MSQASKIRVAVLRGGPSHSYDNSLKTGARVLTLLGEMRDRYEPVDVFISKNGEWHYKGVAHKPEDVLWHTHVVWNALHGQYGEDGEVHNILHAHKALFTGSLQDAAHLSLNKDLAKSVFESHGMRTPQHELLTPDTLDEDRLIHIFRSYLHPVIIKPATGASWVGVRPAYTYAELKEAILAAFSYSPRVLVEEFIRGKTATCLVVEGARGELLHTLMPVEIGEESDSCPGSFSTEENKRVEDMAKQAHEALGMRHYSSSDFVVTSRGNVYILETNSSPEFHEEAPAHKAFGATGWKPHDFLDHCINLALNK